MPESARMPTRRHPKTGLFKRRLAFEELMQLSVDGIVALERQPMPFSVPTPSTTSPTAVADWLDAAGSVERRAAGRVPRRRAPTDQIDDGVHPGGGGPR
jgi:hypothetical protein